MHAFEVETEQRKAHSKSGTLWLKLYVCLLYVFDTLHEVFLLRTVYGYLVKDIGNVEALGTYSKLVLMQKNNHYP